jgi:hypothetical protein
MTKPSLLDRVYTCRACVDANLPFAKAFEPSDCPKKLPPTIGAKGQAKLLFMAINPRLNSYVFGSGGPMHSSGSFALLSVNRDHYGRDYLQSYSAKDGKPRERFYRTFVEIAQEVYPVKAFEEITAVTDLYFCATPASGWEYNPDKVRLLSDSLCARTFFPEVFAQTHPLAIITKGRPPMEYFAKHYLPRRTLEYRIAYPIDIGGISTTLIPLHWSITKSDKRWTVEQVKEINGARNDV